jgi:hypothetical protein
MEEEIQIRIKEDVDSSVLTEIKNYTNGLRTFFCSVAAGVLSGVVFAIILIVLGRIYDNWLRVSMGVGGGFYSGIGMMWKRSQIRCIS